MDGITYVLILKDTLIKKEQLLDELIKLTKAQEKHLYSPDIDIDAFDETLPLKEKFIIQLERLDDGFDMIYQRVREEISSKDFKYKEHIIELQELIKCITEKSTKLQISEKQNKTKLEAYLMKQKKEIKDFKLNSQTVSNYYKNMENQHYGESYFLDKKK